MAKNILDEACDEKTAAFNHSISEVVVQLYRRQGFSQARFADKIGYTRPNFNATVKKRGPQRIWKLKYLMLAAEALGVKVSDIILAAEQGKTSLGLLLAGTKEATPERLERILQEVLDFYPAEDDSGLLQLTMNVRDLRGFAPWLYEGYVKGEISDQQAYNLLAEAQKKASEYVGKEEGDYRILWHYLVRGERI